MSPRSPGPQGQTMFQANVDVALRTISIVLMAIFWPNALAVFGLGESIPFDHPIERWLSVILAAGGGIQTLAFILLISGHRRAGQILVVGGWICTSAAAGIVGPPAGAMPQTACALTIGIVLSVTFERPLAVIGTGLATAGLWVAHLAFLGLVRGYEADPISWMGWLTAPTGSMLALSLLTSWGLSQVIDVFELLTIEKLRAEASDNAKTGFLANMSHELRTPLNAIRGYTEIVQDAVEESLKPTADVLRRNRWTVTEDSEHAGREDVVVVPAQFYQDVDSLPDLLARVHNASAHLTGLVDDVLDMSAIQGGRLEIQRQLVDLREAVAEAAQMVRPLSDHNGNRLWIDLGEARIQIVADMIRFRQVMINLLSNAAKFTNEGVITVHARPEGSSVVIQVQDTGRGIEESRLPTIWEPFVRHDAPSRQGNQPGTGLGLAITRALIHAMGGTIAVSSRLGHGSVFSIRLPLATQDGSVAGDIEPSIARR